MAACPEDYRWPSYRANPDGRADSLVVARTLYHLIPYQCENPSGFGTYACNLRHNERSAFFQ